MIGNFEDLSDKISSLEKKLYPPQEFSGELLIRKGVEFSPPEFNRLSYEDVLFFYERMNKVKKTAEKVMKFAPAERSRATEEVEQKIQAISREVTILEFEEGFYHETEAAERPVSIHETYEEKHPIGEFDIPESKVEKKSRSMELKIEEEEKPKKLEKLEIPEKPIVPEPEPKAKYSAIVFESIVKPKQEEEHAVSLVTLTREIPYILSHETPEFPALSLLSMKPQQYSNQLYEAISGHSDLGVESKADKSTVKVKMLELTKMLFKEKSVHERDRIKKEIIQLKDMLTTSSPTGKKVAPISISQLVFQVTERELYELSSKLEDVLLIKLYEAFTGFSEALSMTDNHAKKEEEFDLFSADLDSILKQFNELSERTEEFLVSAHELLFEKIKSEDLEASEKSKITKVSTNLDDEYTMHFESLSSLVKRCVELFRAAGKSKAGLEKNKNFDILLEVSEQKEEQLLNYLNAKAQAVYSKFSSRETSKLEALLRARMLLAKEKGLSNELIDKYFKIE